LDFYEISKYDSSIHYPEQTTLCTGRNCMASHLYAPEKYTKNKFQNGFSPTIFTHFPSVNCQAVLLDETVATNFTNVGSKKDKNLKNARLSYYIYSPLSRMTLCMTTKVCEMNISFIAKVTLVFPVIVVNS
jgi:hypothetical protein